MFIYKRGFIIEISTVFAQTKLFLVTHLQKFRIGPEGADDEQGNSDSEPDAEFLVLEMIATTSTKHIKYPANEWASQDMYYRCGCCRL
jgi:hypothetical protein